MEVYWAFDNPTQCSPHCGAGFLEVFVIAPFFSCGSLLTPIVLTFPLLIPFSFLAGARKPCNEVFLE